MGANLSFTAILVGSCSLWGLCACSDAASLRSSASSAGASGSSIAEARAGGGGGLLIGTAGGTNESVSQNAGETAVSDPGLGTGGAPGGAAGSLATGIAGSPRLCRVLDFEEPTLEPGEAREVGATIADAPGISIAPLADSSGLPLSVVEMSERCEVGQWLGTSQVVVAFDPPLEPPVSVAVNVRMSMGPDAVLLLQDKDGNAVVEARAPVNPPLLPDCVTPGEAAGNTRSSSVPLVAHSSQAVSQAVVAYDPQPNGFGYVVYIDNLSVSASNLEGEAVCPWNEDGEIQDDTPRCELELAEGQYARYLCLDKPADSSECESCDVECMRDRVSDMPLSTNECLPYPDEIACGPIPSGDACCYYVLATRDWCRD